MSQRLHYMDAIADGLRDRDFAQLRNILRTCGVDAADPYDSWNGGFPSPGEYLHAHLADLTDAVLVELRGYAGGSPTPDRLAWEEDCIRLFMSHLASEKALITEVKERLEHFGFTSFIAHEDINPSAAWREAIEAHLTSADVLVAFVHPGFYESDWTEQEVGWGLGAGIPIVSVVLDSATPLRGFMASRQALLLAGQPIEQVAKAIATAVAKDFRLVGRAKEATLKRLVASRNFFETRDAALHLEAHFGRLTEGEASRLRAAQAANDQIAGFRVAIDAIERMLQRAESSPSPYVPDPDEEPF